ncbi:MAG: hypothetical protein JXR76_30995 [Deltaproteobacteria bacterium]|nr:hypothetical protein [Deltaproteobacteria bacterium]
MQKIILFCVAINIVVASRGWAGGIDEVAPENPLPMVLTSIVPEDIPQSLREWIPWVLADETDYGCTSVKGEWICTWPSTLSLRLTDTEGAFEQRVTVDSHQYVRLPGSLAHWPRNIRVDNVAVPVLAHNGLPMIKLQRGQHRIQGEFKWPHLPEGLNVPESYALIEMHINDTPVPFVQRDADGRIWLRKTSLQSQTEDKLTLEVFRKIADGVPMIVTTHIVVRSSGKSSEVTLENVQLPKTVPMTVTAELPARLTPEGHLKIQTRGGTWSVEIESIVNRQTDQFTALKRNAPWPKNEIWVFAPNEQLRQTEINGLTGVDPQRTNLKDDWKSLAAYVVSPGHKMEIHTTRRGEANPPPDQIKLSRRIWLDMDGEGCTVADTISGTLNRTNRLDLVQDAKLGHVQINGTDQVITANPQTKKSGVELRHTKFEIEGESRIDSMPKTLPAIGWNTDVQELRTTLHLPPGWNLITATGVDNVPGTWWDEWTLFGFFFVLLASIATGRLTKWYFGILALFTLVLLHNEAPIEFLSFVGLPLLIGLALIKSLPKSKLRVGVIAAWSLFALILVVSAIPFSVDQVRQGLFPQLENEYYAPEFTLGAKGMSSENDFYDPSELRPELKEQLNQLGYPGGGKGVGGAQVAQQQMAKQDVAKAPVQRKMRTKMDGLLARSSLDDSWGDQKVALQQDPKAVVQTGPGVPDWHWKEFHLNWQGPVSTSEEIQLFLIGPATLLAMAILRVILLTVLAGILILATFRAMQNPPSEGPTIRLPGRKSAAMGTGVLMLLLSSAAHAEFPENPLLAELRNRLTRSPDCAPNCVDTPALHINVVNGELLMEATVHAAAQSAWPLPGPMGNWVPDETTLDGNKNTAMRLESDGFIYLQIPPGIHRVTLKGRMKNESAFTLEFDDVPHSGSITADGYTVDGLRADGHFETSIAISRKFESSDTEAEATQDSANTNYTPWLKVERSFDLGIPWLINTTVTRVSPTGAPLMIRIPLISGETVTASELETKDGFVSIPFGRDEEEIRWSSVLKETDQLTIAAPQGENWTETWAIQCSPVWQCAFDGLPPVDNSVERKIFRPWPGEKLTVQTHRPKAVEGQTVTIDRARLNVSPGSRLTESHLSMSLRSSQGGVRTITLPESATIQSLKVNGARRPFKQKKNIVEVTLFPGQQNIELAWQQPGGIGARFDAPLTKIDSTVANFHLTVRMPDNRWLIGVAGPSWGPAVLFWGYLLTILIVSFFILGRTARSHLKGWQWALLSLGLTQVPIGVALVIVAWFFLINWRNGNPMQKYMYIWHNLFQVAVGIFTIISFFCLVGAVYNGLAVQPDMQVSGLGSSNSVLNWYSDHSDGTSPAATVWSVPILIWKGIMLAWALWLSYSLITWAKWGFHAFNEGGIWREMPPRVQPQPAAVASGSSATDAAAKTSASEQRPDYIPPTKK